MNSILYVICLCQWISTRNSKNHKQEFDRWIYRRFFSVLDAFEINRQESNVFLQQIPLSTRKRYELSREVVESTRESCLNEYQHYQQLRSSSRRQSLSPVCQKYCAETNDCQQESGYFNAWFHINEKDQIVFLSLWRRNVGLSRCLVANANIKIQSQISTDLLCSNYWSITISSSRGVMSQTWFTISHHR